METKVSKKTLGAVAGAALAMSLVAMPANAHGNHGYGGPLAAFIAFSWLAHHSGHAHHHHHGHYRYKYKRRHSHSHGGYKYKRRHYNHYKH